METREGRSLAVYKIESKQTKKVENGTLELLVTFVGEGGLRFYEKTYQ